MSEARIRRADTADIGAIERLVADAFGKYVTRMGKPPAPMTADYTQELATSRVWVIEDDAAIVAVLVTKAVDGHVLLETVAVAPDKQGNGYAAQLLARAEHDAAELGLTEIRLYTNEAMTENFAFYQRHGYTETARGSQDGFRRVFFSKTISSAPTSSGV